MLIVDAKALVAAVGLIAAAIGGGETIGYGVEVALVWDGETLEIGVDPRAYVAVPDLPFGLSGVTMSNVVLVRYSETWYGLPSWTLPWVQRERDRVLDYESGHFYGWQRFGITYPVEVLANPAAYDPCTLATLGGSASACPKRSWELAEIAPPSHSLFRLTLARRDGGHIPTVEVR